MKDPRFAKLVLLINGVVPLGMLAWDAYNGQIGANPVNDAIHITGVMTLIFLSLTLAVTPVRKITGWNWLSHFRRMLGLFAFFYASVHLLIYFGYDKSFNVSAVIQDVIKRNFILFGMTALLLMAPLAATSTNGIIKKMGAANWKRLHKLVYIVGISAVIHFWMFGKLVGLKQEAFAGILALLLGYRLVAWQMAQMRKNRVAVGATTQ